jgi:hypothetical protein
MGASLVGAGPESTMGWRLPPDQAPLSLTQRVQASKRSPSLLRTVRARTMPSTSTAPTCPPRTTATGQGPVVQIW